MIHGLCKSNKYSPSNKLIINMINVAYTIAAVNTMWKVWRFWDDPREPSLTTVDAGKDTIIVYAQ